MAKRGFFAELNYQAQQAEKRRRQQEAAAARARATAIRNAEKARRDVERAHAAMVRATAAEKKAAEKEAARLHVESRLAEVESLNASLTSTLSEIDGLLAATLDVDDYINLESLKIRTVDHPPFEPGALATPTPAPPELVCPPEPVYQEPPAPSGLAAAFGGKKKHQMAIDRARAEHDKARHLWHEKCVELQKAYRARQEAHQKAEADRLEMLAQAEAAYQQRCRQRDAEAEARNQDLDKFINDLAFDVPDAIEEYVGIVLSNSIYPEAFPITHEHTFDLGARELTLTVTIPEPTAVPTVKEYRYVKAKDEITATPLPVKSQKERYASAVWQVAVRSLHEVFEADRAGKINSLALTVGVDRVAPATGRAETVPLVAVAADRQTFGEFDLANVVPRATLEHLGAAMSKAPYDLTPADTGPGVRVRRQA
jgi:restriction system protein